MIFNHLCWKLIQINLADPLQLTRLQTTLWGFFWETRTNPDTSQHSVPVNRKPHSAFSTTN